MQFNKEQWTEITKLTETVALKFFILYGKRFFQPAGFVYEDIKQEAYLGVLDLFNKNENSDFETLNRLISKAAAFQLRKLKLYCVLRNPVLNNEVPKLKDVNEIEDIKEDELFDLQEYEDGLYKDNMEDIRITDFYNKELNEILDEKEFKILMYRVDDNWTFDKIADNLNQSKQYIYKIFNAIQKKLSKKLGIFVKSS